MFTVLNCVLLTDYISNMLYVDLILQKAHAAKLTDKEKEIENLKSMKYTEDRMLNKQLTDLKSDLDHQKLQHELLLSEMRKNLDATTRKKMESVGAAIPPIFPLC